MIVYNKLWVTMKKKIIARRVPLRAIIIIII